MIKKTSGVLLATLLLGLASCSEENPWMGEAGRGAIKLSVAADANVKESVPVTRASGSYVIHESLLPSASDFDIHILKADGSYDRHFSHDDFLREQSFPTGNYTLRAFSGDPELEGYDCPYFEGTTEVIVLEGKEVPAKVTASVKRALINVEYSDNFANYMKDYSASLHSDGHDYIPVEKDETRPVYLIPGTTTLGVTVTNKQGQTVTIEPDNFQTSAGCHYTIKLDIKESSLPGVATLGIEFSDALDTEDVYIDLTDELFTSPAPEIRLTGIDSAGADEVPTIEFLAGEAPEGKYRFTVLSYGGLKEVKMTLDGASDDFFKGDIQLLNAGADVQSKLESYGINCKGLFKNPEKMAYIDFSELPANLPSGNYKLIVEAKDLLNRTSNIAKVNINSVKATLVVEPKDAIFGVNTGTLVIDYNGSHPEKDITFKADDKYGNMVDAPIIGEPVESLNTRSFESKKYVYTIQLPDFGGRDKEPVEVYLYGEYQETVELNVVVPQYDVVADGFARKVVLKVTATDSDQLPAIASGLKVYDENGSLVGKDRISVDPQQGLITVTGLEPDRTYSYSASLISKTGSDLKAINFVTEPASQLANGDFSASSNTINLPNTNVNGIFQISFGIFKSNTQVYTTLNKNTPDNWANLNQVTCFPGSSNKNTWYMVPSTWAENGQAVIQSVGYHHNGEDIPSDIRGLSTAYYSTKVPNTLNASTGELFLGSYPFSENATTRTDGIEWKSRPSTLSFDYRYEPQEAGEQGEAYIYILGESSNVLATQTVYLDRSDDMKNITVALPPYQFGEKAASIKVGFKSTRTGQTPALFIPQGTDLKEDEINSNNYRGDDAKATGTTWNGTLKINNYHAYARGSKLTVDNVKLGYDDNAAQAASKKRKSSSKRR